MKFSQGNLVFKLYVLAAWIIFLTFIAPQLTAQVKPEKPIPPAAAAPAPTKVEAHPLSPVGSIAAESIRTKWQEINNEYQALQEDEREKLKLGPDWNLDVLGNRMIRQAAAAGPSPTPQSNVPKPESPAPTTEEKSKKK